MAKSVKKHLEEVREELNAVKAADMAMEMIEAFVQDALNKGTKAEMTETLETLAGALPALKAAIPANVVPASAGPVGKTPREHIIDAVHAASLDTLEQLRTITGSIQQMTGTLGELLMSVNKATEHANIAITNARNIPEKELQ